MDVLILSRLQFAMTAGFHFIFVSLTLGLSVLVALDGDLLRPHRAMRSI